MAKATIPSSDLGLGRVVLLATDSVGMACEGAFWIFDKREVQWNFFLVTSLNDAMGAREVYLHLDSALTKRLSEKELDVFPIYITNPRDRLVKLIASNITTDRRATVPEEVQIDVEGDVVTAVVYRMASGLDEPEVRRAKKRFLKLSELEVA
jgi:hypothetical protein